MSEWVPESGWYWMALITIAFITAITVSSVGYWLVTRQRWCRLCHSRGHRKWLFLGTHRTHRWYLKRQIKKARSKGDRWTTTRRKRTCRR